MHVNSHTLQAPHVLREIKELCVPTSLGSASWNGSTNEWGIAVEGEKSQNWWQKKKKTKKPKWGHFVLLLTRIEGLLLVTDLTMI